MQAEVQYLVERLLEKQRSLISFRGHVYPSVSNNVSFFLFGSRYPFEDHRKQLFDENVFNTIRVTEGVCWINILPEVLKKFATMISSTKRAAQDEGLRNLVEFARYVSLITNFLWENYQKMHSYDLVEVWTLVITG